MKKTIGLLCGLTLLSSCSYLEFWNWEMWKDSDKTTTETSRRDPMHNAPVTAPENPATMMPQAGTPSMSPPPAVIYQAPAAAPAQMQRTQPMVGNPNMATPPLPGTQIPNSNSRPARTLSLMSMEVVQNSEPAAGSSETQLVAHVSDDDSSQPADDSANASETKESDASVSAKSAALPPLPGATSSELSGTSQDEFPKLSEVPPTPEVAKSANASQVKQMKEDLNSMQEQRMSGESGKPVVMKSEPPVPPAGTVPPAQPMVMSAANSTTAMDNPGLLPEGPTIVVHSKKGANQAPATKVWEPEPIQIASPAKTTATASAAPLPPIPSSFGAASRPQTTASPPQTLGSSQAMPPMQPLHVAAKEPMPAASDYPQDMNRAAIAQENETGLSGLSPAPSGGHHYRLLPESRYAKLRGLK